MNDARVEELRQLFEEALEPLRAQVRNIEALVEEKKAELAALYELRKQAEKAISFSTNGAAKPAPKKRQPTRASRDGLLDDLAAWLRTTYTPGEDITIREVAEGYPASRDVTRRALISLADRHVVRLDRLDRSGRGSPQHIYRLTEEPTPTGEPSDG